MSGSGPVDVSVFQEIAQEKHGVTLVVEQAHEVNRNYEGIEGSNEEHVADYIEKHNLLNLS